MMRLLACLVFMWIMAMPLLALAQDKQEQDEQALELSLTALKKAKTVSQAKLAASQAIILLNKPHHNATLRLVAKQIEASHEAGLADYLTEQVAKLYPSNPVALLMRASSLLQQKRIEEALTPLATVIKQEPRHIEALQHLSAALLLSGREAEALASLRHLKTLYPLMPDLDKTIDTLTTKVEGRAL